jgi:DnaJ domain
MPDLYRVLGLTPRAGEEEIKAQYRALAKQSHPDVNAGDAAAELRTKLINFAYETLRNVERRAAYDTALVRRQAQRRRRLRRGAAATFGLTLVVGALGAYWARPWSLPTGLSHPLAGSEAAKPAVLADARPVQPSPGEGEAPRERSDAREEPAGGAEAREGQGPPPWAGREAPVRQGLAGTALAESGAQGTSPLPQFLTEAAEGPAASAAPPGARDDSGPWAVLKNARLGFALRYPAEVFAPVAGNAGEHLRLLVSRDGRVVLSIFFADGARDQLAARRRALMQGRYAGAIFYDTALGEAGFVLSGTLGAEAFYEQVAAACDGRSMIGWQVVYPLSEREVYARLVEEMRSGYSLGDAHGARCGEPRSRVTDVKRDRLAP